MTPPTTLPADTGSEATHRGDDELSAAPFPRRHKHRTEKDIGGRGGLCCCLVRRALQRGETANCESTGDV